MHALFILQVDNGYAVWEGDAHLTPQMRINSERCVPRWVFVSPIDLASFVSRHMSAPTGADPADADAADPSA